MIFSCSVGVVIDVSLCIELGGIGNLVVMFVLIVLCLLLDGKLLFLIDKCWYIEDKFIKIVDSVMIDVFF